MAVGELEALPFRGWGDEMGRASVLFRSGGNAARARLNRNDAAKHRFTAPRLARCEGIWLAKINGLGSASRHSRFEVRSRIRKARNDVRCLYRRWVTASREQLGVAQGQRPVRFASLFARRGCSRLALGAQPRDIIFGVWFLVHAPPRYELPETPEVTLIQ